MLEPTRTCVSQQRVSGAFYLTECKFVDAEGQQHHLVLPMKQEVAESILMWFFCYLRVSGIFFITEDKRL